MLRLIFFVITLLNILSLLHAQDIRLGNKHQIGAQDSVYFYKIHDVKIDKGGQIFVTDRLGFKVYKFNEDNRLVVSSGRQGRGPGEFEGGPSSIAVSDKHILIFDLSAGRIAHILDKKNLEYQDTYDLKFASSAAYDWKQRILTCYHDYKKNTYLHTFETGSKEYLSYPLDDLERYSRINKFKILTDIANKRILLVFYYYNRIEVLNEELETVDRYTIPGLEQVVPLYKPESTKQVVSHFKGKEAEIVENASYFPEYQLIKGAAVDGKGKLFVQTDNKKANSTENQPVYIFDPNGDIIDIIEIPAGEILMSVNNENLVTINGQGTKLFKYEIIESSDK